MAQYTEGQMLQAFLAGANRSVEEWIKARASRANPLPSRLKIITKLRREWANHILANIEEGRGYWQRRPKVKAQAAGK